MRPETLEKAIFEAERFIAIAKEVVIIAEPLPNKKIFYRYLKYNSPKNSACKRASLDLTRALAEMRKP